MTTEPKPTVTLRPWDEGDLWIQERSMGDAAMTKYLGGPESPEKVRDRHERYLRMNESDKGQVFVIVVGPENKPAGWIGYWESESDGEIVWEMGWAVLPEFQGQGLATLATLAVIEQVRATGKHRFLHAFPSVENGPSNAICRKAGFRLLGEEEIEFPIGHLMQGNNWQFDLFPDNPSDVP